MLTQLQGGLLMRALWTRSWLASGLLAAAAAVHAQDFVLPQSLAGPGSSQAQAPAPAASAADPTVPGSISPVWSPRFQGVELTQLKLTGPVVEEEGSLLDVAGLQGHDGQAEVLNRPIHGGQPGRERVSASHLGLWALPLHPDALPVQR